MSDDYEACEDAIKRLQSVQSSDKKILSVISCPLWLKALPTRDKFAQTPRQWYDPGALHWKWVGLCFESTLWFEGSLAPK